jgi:chromosome segregation ATPase
MSSLNESTEEFMRIIRGDTGEIDDATLALERYQKQIESLQSSSSALASSLRQAQNELDSKTREAANYKTQIEKVSKGDGYFDKDGVYHDNPKSTSGSNNNGYTDSQIA